MSIPINITPATAIDVAALPFTYDQDVNEAPTGVGNVPCTGTPYNSTWFKYTVPAGVYFLYANSDWAPGADTGFYSPACSVWIGTPGALTAYTIPQAGTDSEFCSVLCGGFYFRLPVTPGTTYYFQCCHDGSGAMTTGAILRFQLFEPDKVLAPAGSPVVPDDDDEFPAMVLGLTTGAFLRAVHFPAGEFADTNPDGYYCTQNGAANTGVAFYDSQFVQLATVSFAPSLLVMIKSDRAGNFHIMTRTSPATVMTVHKYTRLGVLVWTKTLPSDFNDAYVGAVSQDGVHLYTGSTSSSAPLRVYNLLTNTHESDLAVGTADERFVCVGDGFTLADGTLVFVKLHITPGTYRIVMYNPSTGAQLHTWTPATTEYVNHYCYFDNSTLLVWGYYRVNTNNNAIMERIGLTDGADVSVVTSISVTSGSAVNRDTYEPSCISNSCPLFVLTALLRLPGTEVTQDIRCMRRFPLPFDRSLDMYVSRLEFLIQAGMGLPPESGQGDDPIITVRFSGDGGVTWNNFVQLSAGKQGQYEHRPVINRVGKLRNGVCEFVVSDPVYSYLLDAFIDVGEESA